MNCSKPSLSNALGGAGDCGQFCDTIDTDDTTTGNCPLTWVNNGACDVACFEARSCERDGIDCNFSPRCSRGCVDYIMLGNGECEPTCNNVECGWDYGDCVDNGSPDVPASFIGMHCAPGHVFDCTLPSPQCVSVAQIRDGYCNSAEAVASNASIVGNFNCAAFFEDFGDCTIQSCNEASEPSVPDCSGNCAPIASVGDGVCHDGSTHFACEEFAFDMGDCVPPEEQVVQLALEMRLGAEATTAVMTEVDVCGGDELCDGAGDGPCACDPCAACSDQVPTVQRAEFEERLVMDIARSLELPTDVIVITAVHKPGADRIPVVSTEAGRRRLQAAGGPAGNAGGGAPAGGGGAGGEGSSLNDAGGGGGRDDTGHTGRNDEALSNLHLLVVELEITAADPVHARILIDEVDASVNDPESVLRRAFFPETCIPMLAETVCTLTASSCSAGCTYAQASEEKCILTEDQAAEDQAAGSDFTATSCTLTAEVTAAGVDAVDGSCEVTTGSGSCVYQAAAGVPSITTAVSGAETVRVHTMATWATDLNEMHIEANCDGLMLVLDVNYRNTVQWSLTRFPETDALRSGVGDLVGETFCAPVGVYSLSFTSQQETESCCTGDWSAKVKNADSVLADGYGFLDRTTSVFVLGHESETLSPCELPLPDGSCPPAVSVGGFVCNPLWIGIEPCVDMWGFVDEQGYSCSDIGGRVESHGMDCTFAAEQHGYSEDGEEDIVANCRRSCQLCTRDVSTPVVEQQCAPHPTLAGIGVGWCKTTDMAANWGCNDGSGCADYFWDFCEQATGSTFRFVPPNCGGDDEAGCDGPTGCASVQCGAQAGTFQSISEGEEALFLFEGIAHAEYTLVVLDFGLSNSKMSLYNTDMVELASNDIQQDIDASNSMSRLSSWECPETSVYIVGVRGHTASCACPEQPNPAPRVHNSAF